MHKVPGASGAWRMEKVGSSDCPASIGRRDDDDDDDAGLAYYYAADTSGSLWGVKRAFEWLVPS